jgi:RHH-type rel operon transcriptional repressor/antitoxin RelB
MSTGVVSVRLSDDLKARLDALSASTGRPAAYYVREALVEHLAELEYAYQIKAEAEAIRRGAGAVTTWDELMDESGITTTELDSMPIELD